MNGQHALVNGQQYKEAEMQAYDMAHLGEELDLPEGFFLTREKGEQAYHQIRTRLEAIPDGRPLVLAFPPEQLIDASFADESIVRIMEELVSGTFGERGMLLQGLTEDSIKNVDAVISLHGLKLSFLAVEPDGRWQQIGHLEPSLQETLGMVHAHGKLTAPQLADMVGLAINSASNRLKRLYDQRLVRREYEISERGLQYIYHFWQWMGEKA